MVPYATYAAQVTIEDIPQEYRNDSKILTFISAFSSFQEEEKILISRIREEMFLLYEKYSRLFGLMKHGVIVKTILNYVTLSQIRL